MSKRYAGSKGMSKTPTDEGKFGNTALEYLELKFTSSF